jgi:phosphoglucosamine mutase
MDKYFGTDGVRGNVGKSTITIDFVQKLGNSVAHIIAKSDDVNTVVIGQDTRSSSDLLKFALVSGLNAAGVDVLDLGVVPTPVVAYETIRNNASAGFVITASHNPYTDNGIKIFSAKGSKLSDDIEASIEAQIDKDLVYQADYRFGKYSLVDAPMRSYIEGCFYRFKDHINYSGKLIIDCAHGAGSGNLEMLLDRFGIGYISIASKPDGLNINVESGATHIDNISKAVIEHGADLGISLDGDGDRIMIVDEKGDLIDGDGILSIMSKYHDVCGGTKGIVGTLMTNMSYEKDFAKKGMPFVRSKVGDRYVLEDLNKYGYKIGGESSGHIINLNFSTTGDGLFTAIQLLAILSQSASPVSEFRFKDDLMQQTMINVPLTKKVTSGDLSKVDGDVKEVDIRLGDNGRVLLRPSGTEPVLRVMVEANCKKIATSEAEYLVEKVKQKLV